MSKLEAQRALPRRKLYSVHRAEEKIYEDGKLVKVIGHKIVLPFAALKLKRKAKKAKRKP